MSESFNGPSVEKTFRLYTSTARHIWRLQAEEMDANLNKIQDRLALNCTFEELEMLEDGIFRIIDEAKNKIEEVIVKGQKQVSKLKEAGTAVNYQGAEELSCCCHSPAMVRYIETLVRLDALLMLIDGLWMHGVYSTSDRTALMHQWRSHFLKMHHSCNLLLNRGWSRVQKRRRAAAAQEGSKKTLSRDQDVLANEPSLGVVNKELPSKQENKGTSSVKA